MYLRIRDEQIIYPYQLADFYAENPQTSFSRSDLEERLKDNGIYLVSQVGKPVYDVYTQKCVEVQPQLIDNTWKQCYNVLELTQEEQYTAKKNFCPVVVSMRQAKLALLQAGLLDDVDAVIAQAPRELQIEWEYATEVNRDWPTLATVKTLLNLTEDQLDDLFILASKL